MRTVRSLLVLAAVALVAIQMVPVKQSNPEPRAIAAAPPAVHAVLERACYDCHSNDTTWPWYSRVAPASWLIADHVGEGREHLNFSLWPAMSDQQRAKAREEIAEVLAEGEMPPWWYTPVHADARLTAEEMLLVRGWTTTAAARER